MVMKARERKVLPVCSLCSKVPDKGLRDGFFLKGIFICSACEKRLLRCRPVDGEEYTLMIANMRQILFKE